MNFRRRLPEIRWLYPVCPTEYALAQRVSPKRLSTLYAVKPYDPLTFTLVPAVLFLAAVAACWPAARRATRIAPMETLRYE